MSVSIRHKGTIIAVGQDTVTVAITTSEEDCDGCAISQLCAKKEAVEVYFSNPSPGLIGKSATIEISSSSQTKAVILMLAIPIFIMVAVMLLAVKLGMSELLAAIASIASVTLWYLGVYLSTKNSFNRQSVTIASVDT